MRFVLVRRGVGLGDTEEGELERVDSDILEVGLGKRAWAGRA